MKNNNSKKIDIQSLINYSIGASSLGDYLKLPVDFVQYYSDWKRIADKENTEEDCKRLQETIVQHILTLDVAIYMFRRIPGCAGEQIDILQTMRNGLLIAYRGCFQKDYIDVNKDIDF